MKKGCKVQVKAKSYLTNLQQCSMGKSKVVSRSRSQCLRSSIVRFCRRICLLIADMDRTGTNNVAQLAGVESSNKFTLTIEARHKLLNEADHLSRFHVTGGFELNHYYRIRYLLFCYKFSSNLPVFNSLGTYQTRPFESELALSQSN